MASTQSSSTTTPVPGPGLAYEEFEDEPDPYSTPEPSGLLSAIGRLFSQPALSPRSSYAILAAACGYGGTITNLRNSAKIQRLKRKCQVHNDILLYIKNSQVGRKLKVIQIYKVERNSDKDSDFDEPYRLMLWHGTLWPSVSIPGIIQSGFRKGIDGLFGGGCYFADRIGKSQGYCFPSSSGYMFFVLAEVALGKVYKARNINTDYSQAPAGYDTVIGNGSSIPKWSENKKYFDAILPCGPTVQANKHQNYSRTFNEYIAYDPSRIKVRFIVQCQ